MMRQLKKACRLVIGAYINAKILICQSLVNNVLHFRQVYFSVGKY